MMILLTGANGVVGYPLSAQLTKKGYSYLAVSRKSAVSKSAIEWDLESVMPDNVKSQLMGCDTLIHCAPIWLLAGHLDNLKAGGIKRLIVFSSTSVISKDDSANVEEQQLVSLLATAEKTINRFCSDNALNLTILRPSMIYGHGRDQNVMRVTNFIRKFGFMVIVGKADGERQPVHADDLVGACFAILEKPNTYGKTYNLAGGEALTYRSMVERIFIAMQKEPRIFSLPLSVFRFALRAAATLTSFAYTPEMADRMNKNMSYSNEDATRDFAYKPQLFLQNPQRDLNIVDEVGPKS